MVCPSPLEVQIKACPPIIAGNDVLLSTHTGSGKTLAFLTPIAQNVMVNPSKSILPKALIVAPGRELASQIVSVAQKLFVDTDLTVGMVIGGTSYARNVEMLRTKKPDVVVGTPGRVAELILGKSGDK
jgi:superfamily II DNA/RNA helicase